MIDSETSDLEEFLESVEANDFVRESKNKIKEIIKGIDTLKNKLISKKNEFSIPLDRINDFEKLFNELINIIFVLEVSLNNLKNPSDTIKSQSLRLVIENLKILKGLNNWRDYMNFLRDLIHNVNMVQAFVSRDIQKEEFLAYKEDTDRTVAALKERELELIKSIEEVKVVFEQTKNLKIHDYYELAAKENQSKADINRVFFISLIFLSLTIIWFSLVTKGYFGLSGYDYYFFKGSLVLTSITLITYFLKQSVKYQKIADQCKQTKLELEAFPSYVANLSQEDPLIADLRKELAMKYFGRDVDNKSNDETSNILQDQMKNTTEMVKAAMEVLKKSGNS
ncbi:hypothetical protein WDA43_08170 [Acinetobacter nosocomialis]|uniref:hypothetical protein n=1 Tax=Acinetobacter nosocomialis TaxID=106654 RepID=UPI001BC87972|nr:hypothetical protein [Acinetobacter nosocomialis]MDQ8906556.1 hypothetical protein [Acinetobacter nosocomialis]